MKKIKVNNKTMTFEEGEICGTNGIEDEKEKKKNTRKKPSQLPYELKIVMNADETRGFKTLGYLDDNQEFNQVKFDMREVKMKRSAEEKARQRRLNRTELLKDPINLEKFKSKNNTKEAIEKRKTYSKKPEVQTRKKTLSKQSRGVSRVLKKTNPDLYNELLKQIQLK